MRIGIIGFGYVGKAIFFAHTNDDLVIRDPKLEKSAELHEFNSCEAIYVCVPIPPTHDGRCDTSVLENVLKELLFVLINKEIPIICKTTAPPSAYESLQKQYPSIVHCPEFLTAADNIRDYARSNYFVLGGDPAWCVKARSVIQLSNQIVDSKFIIMSIKAAALYKYMMNSYLATKVTFMNDFKSLADAEDVNWGDLLRASVHDNRIGDTHMNVPGPDGQYGWGGGCFPKDVAAITMEAIDLTVDFELLDRVETINVRHRRK